MNTFTTLCTPAKIYLIILVPIFFSMIYNKSSVWNFVSLLVWAPIWTFVLNWLCKKGYSFVSWFLVFFPLASLMLLTILYTNQLLQKK